MVAPSGRDLKPSACAACGSSQTLQPYLPEWRKSAGLSIATQSVMEYKTTLHLSGNDLSCFMLERSYLHTYIEHHDNHDKDNSHSFGPHGNPKGPSTSGLGHHPWQIGLLEKSHFDESNRQVFWYSYAFCTVMNNFFASFKLFFYICSVGNSIHSWWDLK